MRKKLNVLAFIFALSMMMLTSVGCSDSASSASSSDADELILKAGFSTGEADPRVVATELFKEEVETNSNGRILVDIYCNGDLGSDAELIEGVINGTVDLTASSAGNFSNYVSDVGISALPFLFNNFQEAWNFVDGPTEAAAEEGLKDHNIVVLGHYDNGFRCVTTSQEAGPIRNVSDMKGIIIRTPDNPIVMETMKALGATPQVLEFPKVYDALMNGEFDAQENPIPVIYNNNLYDVQANLSITNHSYDVMPFVIRKDIWDKLSDSDKQILLDAAVVAQEKDRSLIKEQTDDYVNKLEKAGMTITNPDLSQFREATQSVYDTLASNYDPELLEAIR